MKEMQLNIQSPNVIKQAYYRIQGYIIRTPILYSNYINELFGNNVFFKIDSTQETGAFKIRGILNYLLSLKEQNKLPKKIVTYSTGNHGIALAWAGKLLDIHIRIYFPKNIDRNKYKLASKYDAQIIETNTRIEAEINAKTDKDFHFLHPSDSDLVIAGAGTMCLEALDQLGCVPDAIFASCGGGGLLAGSYLAKELLSPNSALIGCEPIKANDAFLSLQQEAIYKFDHSPNTIADGLRSLSLSPRTFQYIKKLDDFFLVDEESIHSWTMQLNKLLNVACEPSCSLNMGSVEQWLKKYQFINKNLLVLISGGNFDFNKFINQKI